MSGQDQAPLKTYRGNCHCKAYLYEVKLPTDKNLRFVTGDPATLTNYAYGEKKWNHKFCPTCGNSIFVIENESAGATNPRIGVNVRTFQPGQGVDVWKMNRRKFDGASLPPAYHPPQYTGPQPKVEVDGGKTYTGSCHCGAVRLALVSKPLDKTFVDKIVEYNCSSDSRAGTVWTYPHEDQVVIQGEENLGLYLFGTRIAGKTFCKLCGVPVSSVLQPIPDEALAKLPSQTQQFVASSKDKLSVNLRLFDDVDLTNVNVARMDGYNLVQPPYTEP